MPPSPAAIHYRVVCADPHAQRYAVTLTIAAPAARQRVRLPVWIPGSYLVREFAKNLSGLQAQQGRRARALRQIDKASWELDCAANDHGSPEGHAPLILRYEVTANDTSVRGAWLDTQRGFFNATSLCLRVEDHDHEPHTIEIVPPPHATHWSCATALRALKTGRRGFGLYHADDYDELADSPVALGVFWSGEFTACGVPHRFVVSGAGTGFDGARLLADTRTVCETQMRFWHGAKAGQRGGARPVHDRYVFLLNAMHEGYGGLEHRHSTALMCKRDALPRLGVARQDPSYTTLLGLISHEYFHTWNVKRMRPAEFARYDYGRENYTALLWFFEGLTSYYDDLLLRRAGLIDDAAYLRLLGQTIDQMQQMPGRHVQSVAQASFDAWVKYYRMDEHTPNITVSYYLKGALIGLCLDLTLRASGQPDQSLDAVMRRLWQDSRGGPIDETAIADALRAVGQRSYARELTRWVHSTQALPLAELLRAHGVAVRDEAAAPAQALGLRVDESTGTLRIKMVLHGGPAQKAGFIAGDEWIGVEQARRSSRSNRSAPAAEGWRITRLEELAPYLGPRRKFDALVARDRRLLRLSVQLPAQRATRWLLAIQDASLLERWLGAA
ncbi:MAG: peptidase M61 [Burkholderiaceae bacterium]|nr:peptidase M61 [Burkholderiaceae bacterium]